MKSKSLLLFTSLLIAASTSTLLSAEPLRAGAATSVITPEIGREIIGGFVPFPSKHIHDELHARCLVLDDGTTKIALVVCDLLGIHRVVSDEARRLIQEKSGIARECVMISATHTHSASSALGEARWLIDQQPDEYQRFIAQRIADGVARAVNNLRPAQLAFGAVDVPEHLNNRRWHMMAGTVPPNPFGGQDLVKMNPPSGSPNLIEPAGPIDPTVSFIAVRGTDGLPISIFAAYSLHYVGGTGPTDVSADYYGYFCESLKQLMTAGAAGPLDMDRPPFVALMANGTSGDINNIDFRKPRGVKQPYEQMRFVAEDVAKKVHAATTRLEYRDGLTLASRYREPTIAWRRPNDEQKKWAADTIAAGPKSKSDLSFIYAERVTKLASYPETTTIPLHIIRIGDICLGTMPCEVFCEIGIDFKRRSPFAKSFLIELAHGSVGYLPTPRQHQLGGYETWLGTNRLELTASDKLLDNLIEMAKELRDGVK